MEYNIGLIIVIEMGTGDYWYEEGEYKNYPEHLRLHSFFLVFFATGDASENITTSRRYSKYIYSSSFYKLGLQ